MSPYQRALNKALKYDKHLKADADGFRGSVQVTHEDGSTFLLHEAFLKTWVDSDGLEWLMCFTEHNGTLVWALEDLSRYVHLEQIHEKVKAIL